jgi:spore germination protein YaaH
MSQKLSGYNNNNTGLFQPSKFFNVNFGNKNDHAFFSPPTRSIERKKLFIDQLKCQGCGGNNILIDYQR